MNKKKLLSLVLGFTILLTSITVAFAAPIRKTLQAQYYNIKLIIDGKNISFSKNDEPFIVDGVTYLPVRKVGEALGKEVDWDQKTKTITMTDKTSQDNSNYLTDVLSPTKLSRASIYPSGSVDEFYINNVRYTTGIDMNSGSIIYNLDRKYSSLEFDYGIVGDHINYRDKDKIEIFIDKGDGDLKYSETIYMDKNSGIKKHTISLDNVVRIQFYGLGQDAGIGNPLIK